MEQLATLVIGAIASGIGTYVLTRLKTRQDLEARYDADLRHARLTTYAELWKLLQPLALFGRNGFPTPQTLDEMSHSLTAWYFDKGGIYLSVPTREAYFRLQRALRDVTESIFATQSDAPVHGELFEHLRSIGSRLRTRMTMDVGTRKSLMFDESAEHIEASSAAIDDRRDVDEGWIVNHVKPRTERPV